MKKMVISGILLSLVGFATIKPYPEFGSGAILAAVVILTVSIISSYVAEQPWLYFPWIQVGWAAMLTLLLFPKISTDFHSWVSRIFLSASLHRCRVRTISSPPHRRARRIVSTGSLPTPSVGKRTSLGIVRLQFSKLGLGFPRYSQVFYPPTLRRRGLSCLVNSIC